MKIYALDIYDGDIWHFSTKELAEKAIKFFQLDDDEYSLDESEGLDDERILDCINTLTDEERKERGL